MILCPGNAPHLRRMVELGVPGFKCFLIHSGVDEFPAVTEQQVTRAALIGCLRILSSHWLMG